MIIRQHQLQYTPVPKKRKGKFKRNRLTKLLRHPCAGQQTSISTPSDFRHHITVQHEHTSPIRYQCSPSSPESPPSSPSLLRLRAYACKFYKTKKLIFKFLTFNSELFFFN